MAKRQSRTRPSTVKGAASGARQRRGGANGHRPAANGDDPKLVALRAQRAELRRVLAAQREVRALTVQVRRAYDRVASSQAGLLRFLALDQGYALMQSNGRDELRDELGGAPQRPAPTNDEPLETLHAAPDPRD
jgi:hypothetical protein